MITVANKICSHCGQTKSIDEFHKDNRVNGGFRSYCKECYKLYQQNKTNRKCHKREDIEFLPEEKKCSKCRRTKKQSEFYFNSSHSDGLDSQCKKCRKENNKEDRNNHLKLNYGITQTQYDLILKLQNGVCAMCGKTPKENGRTLDVDHSHKTNKIRGLLCGNCNRGLGNLQDNSELLRIGANYLEKTILL